MHVEDLATSMVNLARGSAVRDLIKARHLALVLSVNLAASVAAGPLEDGVNAYEHRNYLAALELLRPLADKGDDAAQAYLGNMYASGWGVPQDYAEALKWYRKAANQGHAGAQDNLGGMYASG